MCEICNKETGVDYTIETIKGIRKICPNCMAEFVLDSETLDNGNFTSEISGESGAIRVTPYGGKPFDVTPSEAHRLIGKALMPNEFMKLLENHSAREFELHDDFYDESSGLAYQPYNDNEYFENLKKYLKSSKIIPGTEGDIAEFIRYWDEDEERE